MCLQAASSRLTTTSSGGIWNSFHECSIYGSAEARFGVAEDACHGRSRPWQDALFELTGQRDIDATAMPDYYLPLREWLDEQNKGHQCGW
jgi:peptidyl-dipeptidase A